MVCLSSEPSLFADLLNRGLEMSARLGSRLYVVHVETLSESVRGAAKERLRELLDGAVAAHEGIEVVWLKSWEKTEALLDFARERRVGMIVVGRSRAGSLPRLFHRSVCRDLIREARNIAIEVVGWGRRGEQPAS
jgi:K+-sensing histidine kinase KdpD